jgi:hypothetical protein
MKRRLLYLLPFIALALSFPGSGGAYEGPIKHGWGWACQSCHTGTITPGNGFLGQPYGRPAHCWGPGTNVFFFEAWSARQISGAWVGDTTKKTFGFLAEIQDSTGLPFGRVAFANCANGGQTAFLWSSAQSATNEPLRYYNSQRVSTRIKGSSCGFSWIAPAAYRGEIIIRLSVLISNDDGTKLGDFPIYNRFRLIYCGPLSVQPAPVTSGPGSLEAPSLERVFSIDGKEVGQGHRGIRIEKRGGKYTKKIIVQ